MLIEILCVNYLRIEVCQILDSLSSTLPKDFTILDWIVVEQRCFLDIIHTLSRITGAKSTQTPGPRKRPYGPTAIGNSRLGWAC